MSSIPNTRARSITVGAMIAAIYAILTYLSTLLNLSFGPIQFRFSEVMTVLPIFTPAAIPGLAIGCFLSNIASPFGIMDVIAGTATTLVAAWLTRKFRGRTFKGIPLLSLLAPVLLNALVVPLVISLPLGWNIFATVYFFQFISVLIGEAVACFALGIPLIALLNSKDLKSKL